MHSIDLTKQEGVYSSRAPLLYYAEHQRRFNPPAPPPSAPRESFKTAEEYALALANFAGRYKWLFEPSNVSFFANEHWQALPNDWKGPLLALTNDELRCLPFGSTLPFKEKFPKSLLAFLDEALYVPVPVNTLPSMTNQDLCDYESNF